MQCFRIAFQFTAIYRNHIISIIEISIITAKYAFLNNAFSQETGNTKTINFVIRTIKEIVSLLRYKFTYSIPYYSAQMSINSFNKLFYTKHCKRKPTIFALRIDILTRTIQFKRDMKHYRRLNLNLSWQERV